MFTTVNDLFEPFLSFYEREGKAESTITNHRTRMQKYIDPTIGDEWLRSLTHDKISRVKERARDGGVSLPAGCTVTVRMLLKYADREGYTVGVDWQEIEVPSYSSKPDEVQYLSENQLKTLREAIPTDRPSGLRTRALLEFLLHTGLRLSEALSLDKKDVNFEKRIVTVKNTKSSRWDKVRVSHSALAWLRKYLNTRCDDDSALFYVTPQAGRGGKRLCKDTAKSYMRMLAKRTDLPAGHHILRRTFGTELMRLRDVDIKTKQRLMRHKDIRTTLNHYVGVEDDRLDEAHSVVVAHL